MERYQYLSLDQVKKFFPHGQYERKLENGLVITNTRIHHAEQLAAMQKIVFPQLSAEHLFHREQYYAHLTLFPDGQFVALDGEKVVGMTSTLRVKFDFKKPQHTLDSISGGGWFSTHDEKGDWLYGTDLGTHPEYRKMGIARALYEARHELVRKLRLKGQMAVGTPSGYGKIAHEVDIRTYMSDIKSGKRFDPTVSVQNRLGLEIVDVIENYVPDRLTANYGLLIRLKAEDELTSRSA